MKRKSAHRPSSGAPRRGKRESGRSDDFTRSRVFRGRLSVRTNVSRFSTAVGVTTTVAMDLEVLEGCVATGSGFRKSPVSALESAWDSVEERGHITRIWIGFVEGSRKQGSGNRARVGMRSLSQTAELERVLIVEDHVHAAGCAAHGSQRTRSSTPCVVLVS